MKWLKIAGISSIILIIIPIVLYIFAVLTKITPSSQKLTTIFTIILFIGFFLLGRYTKRKFLKITSLIILIILFINLIMSIIGIFYGPLLTTLLISTMRIQSISVMIAYLIFGISLFLTKEVKLAKLSGILIIIYYSVIDTVYLRSILIQNNLSVVYLIISILTFLITFSIIAIMFFKASKQFESTSIEIPSVSK